MSELATAVDRIFGDDFLFQAANSTWLAAVCDLSTGAAKSISPSMLVSFPTIAVACKSSGQDEMAKEIAALVASGATRNVVIASPSSDDSSPATIRRNGNIDFEKHPDRRTVFVKPIHYGASERHIKDFFSKWGPVERVERRQFADNSSVLRPRPSAFVVFNDIASAVKCVEAKPSYGALDNDLGNLFVPALTVVLKGHQDAVDETDEKKTTYFQPHVDKETGVTKFLQSGCTLKVKDLASTTTYKDIKMTLGNLALNNTQVKNKVSLVWVEPGTAYVFMKDPVAAQTMMIVYREARTKRDAAFVEKLTAVVPNLEQVTGPDERRIQERYPKMVAGKTSDKQDRNKKRLRDD